MILSSEILERHGVDMTCLQAQSLIIKYVNDEINVDTLELFLRHINNCADCKEELEVYYMLLTGMKQLDEDKILSSDFHLGFLDKLKKSEEKIFQRKLLLIRRKLLFCVLFLFLAFFLDTSSYFFEKLVVEEEVEVYQSNFKLEYYYYDNNMIEFDKYIEQYMEESKKLASNKLENKKKENLKQVSNIEGTLK